MKTIEVRGRLQTSRVLVGESVGRLGFLLRGRPVFLITDANVARLHGPSFPAPPGFILEPGEASKSLETAVRIYRALLERSADRGWFVLGLGGGVVCDIAGFVAGTFLRGLDFGFVPTTLLAQVDASVGGKNGVNLDGGKNLVGLIRQPEFVLCDPLFLKTLPAVEVGNGLAEVIKHGLLADPALLDFLEERVADIKALEPAAIVRLTADSVRIKAAIVAADESERGRRRVLNLGHTLAHAVETVGGAPHGRAVAMGLAFALRLSERLSLLHDAALPGRLERLLRAYDLPSSPQGDPGLLAEALIRDKKRFGGEVDFVLLEAAGRPLLRKIRLDELREALRDLRQPA